MKVMHVCMYVKLYLEDFLPVVERNKNYNNFVFYI